MFTCAFALWRLPVAGQTLAEGVVTLSFTEGVGATGVTPGAHCQRHKHNSSSLQQQLDRR